MVSGLDESPDGDGQVRNSLEMKGELTAAVALLLSRVVVTRDPAASRPKVRVSNCSGGTSRKSSLVQSL